MDILLIHLNPLGKTFHIGSAYITSILESKGHDVSFLQLWSIDEKKILKRISKNNIEIILISVTSDGFGLCKKLIEFINKNQLHIPIILGGIHPTLCPEECINLEGVLGLCIGEGEFPICELIRAIEHNEDYMNINNMWIKKDDIIYKNNLAPLIKDLDVLPHPNYDIFMDYLDFEVLPIILSRGCPFNCSYCGNHAIKRIISGKGNFIRHHSDRYSIELISNLVKRFPNVQAIEFYDDTFTLDINWLRIFLENFRRLHLKFICNSRFDIINEKLIKLLANSGCIRINAAIECGNEKIRKDILRRSISDQEILDKGKLVKQARIQLHVHNMIGIPYETKSDIIKTIEINRKLRPDSFQTSIFKPYPKTDLGELCQKNNWINETLESTSYCDYTILRTPFVNPHIVNFYFLAFSNMVFETGLRLHIKKAICWIMHIHNNKLYLILKGKSDVILSAVGINWIASVKVKNSILSMFIIITKESIKIILVVLKKCLSRHVVNKE